MCVKCRMISLVIVAAVAALWLVTNRPTPDLDIGIGGYSLEQWVINVIVSYLALLLCYIVLGCQSWKRRLARVMLNLLSITFILLLLEAPASIGLLDYRTLLFPKRIHGEGSSGMLYDPELFLRRPPYDHFVTKQTLDPTDGRELDGGKYCDIKYRYDKNGFRNPCDFRQAPIVLIGDSFVEGYLVAEEQTCRALLRHDLGVDVCNLGQSDYGPPRELIVLRRYGLGLRPRVVVWFFFESNDLFDVHDYETTVHGWRRHLLPADSLTSRCFSLNALDYLGCWIDSLRWSQASLQPDLAAPLLPELCGDEVTMYFPATRPTVSPGELSSLTTKTHNILQQAASMCRQNNVEFLLVYIPDKLRVYRDLCVIPEDKAPKYRKVDDLPDRLGRWCETVDIEYLDLTPALISAARSGSLVYYTRDGHWCGKGHAVAAEEIADYIRQAGWLNSRRSRPCIDR